MSQWHVELTCREPQVLAFLTTIFQEPSFTVTAGATACYYVNPGEEPRLTARRTSGYFMLSSEFTSISTATDVQARAKEMLPLLNAIIKLKLGVDTTPIEIDDVFRPDTEGRMIREIASVVAIAYRYPSISQLQNAHAQSPTFIEIWRAERMYPEVEEAMLHFANQRNWFNLYKVYEVIEHDVGKNTINKWMQGQADDFTYSANNARVSGLNARHFSAKFQKTSVKRTPMSLQQAIEFISSLLLQWLQTKPT